MTIMIVLKSGYSFGVKCVYANIKRNKTGRIDNIDFEDITENKPLNVNPDEIAAIYRVLSDE